jgi:hypothetical protein
MADRFIKADGSLGKAEDMHPPADAQTPLHTSIADELIMITPQHWSRIKLALVRRTTSPGGGGEVDAVAHTISSPDGHPELVLPSEKLLERTRELDLLFRRHGARWTTVEYLVTTEEDSWSWKVAFTYDKAGRAAG